MFNPQAANSQKRALAFFIIRTNRASKARPGQGARMGWSSLTRSGSAGLKQLLQEAFHLSCTAQLKQETTYHEITILLIATHCEVHLFPGLDGPFLSRCLRVTGAATWEKTWRGRLRVPQCNGKTVSKTMWRQLSLSILFDHKDPVNHRGMLL